MTVKNRIILFGINMIGVLFLDTITKYVLSVVMILVLMYVYSQK